MRLKVPEKCTFIRKCWFTAYALRDVVFSNNMLEKEKKKEKKKNIGADLTRLRMTIGILN